MQFFQYENSFVNETFFSSVYSADAKNFFKFLKPMVTIQYLFNKSIGFFFHFQISQSRAIKSLNGSYYFINRSVTAAIILLFSN